MFQVRRIPEVCHNGSKEGRLGGEGFKEVTSSGHAGQLNSTEACVYSNNSDVKTYLHALYFTRIIRSFFYTPNGCFFFLPKFSSLPGLK